MACAGSSPHQVVDHPGLVQLVRVEEHVGQLQLLALQPVFAVHALEGGLQQAVAESEDGERVCLKILT